MCIDQKSKINQWLKIIVQLEIFLKQFSNLQTVGDKLQLEFVRVDPNKGKRLVDNCVWKRTEDDKFLVLVLIFVYIFENFLSQTLQKFLNDLTFLKNLIHFKLLFNCATQLFLFMMKNWA